MELGQRVAWSLADLVAKDQPGLDEIHLAIDLWLGTTPRQVRVTAEAACREAGRLANRSPVSEAAALRSSGAHP
jgi:hypothetical protein